MTSRVWIWADDGVVVVQTTDQMHFGRTEERTAGQERSGENGLCAATCTEVGALFDNPTPKPNLTGLIGLASRPITRPASYRRRRSRATGKGNGRGRAFCSALWRSRAATPILQQTWG